MIAQPDPSVCLLFMENVCTLREVQDVTFWRASFSVDGEPVIGVVSYRCSNGGIEVCFPRNAFPEPLSPRAAATVEALFRKLIRTAEAAS